MLKTDLVELPTEPPASFLPAEPYMSRIKSHRTNAFHAQHGLCYYCNCRMWLDEEAEFCKQFKLTKGQAAAFRCTAEHLVARCDGGKDSAGNIVAACRTCNARRHARKHAMAVDRYKIHVAKFIRRSGWHAPHPIRAGLYDTPLTRPA